ncbi:DEAD/DEAH box helicase family protein [Methanothermococcus sp. SCGC AD-155-N22]|nr:DEAD/DEAH box helicase family protein [Methanothermococcus sp. SCGC AD-155-N22]
MINERKIAPHIIDNSPGRELLKVIKDQLKRSKEAKFAIGYFFLSGFSLVREDFPEEFSKRPFLKIIMGNETTYSTKEELVEGYNLRELFKQRMIEELQEKEFSEDQIKQLKTLRDFIAKNIIDVRLYDRSRLHAKLYLFLRDPEERYGSPGLAVVGSSNFTREGLVRNKELNILLTSREDVLYLDRWFDELWEESVEFREDLLKVIDISGVLPGSPYPKIGKLIDSQTLFKYLVYRWFEGRVLNLLKKDILLEFQLVGVVNAVDKINFYNGVILADSVGLGKSFIASTIIEEFLNKKHPAWVPEDKDPSVMLILPPSIINQWEELLIYSQYFLKDNKIDKVKDKGNFKIYKVFDKENKYLGKIAFLSLGKFQNLKEHDLKKFAEEYDFFVIDEAHKYRNKNTNRWRNVRKLQKKESGFSNKFLLLTATPLNNSINDIFNLIRLFMDDTFTPFMIKGVPIVDLIKRYKDLKKEFQKKGDSKIKRELKKVATEIKQKVLDEIMILRTRKYIMEQFKDIKINDKPLVFKDPIPYSLDYFPFYTKDYKSLIEVINNNLNKILFEHTKIYGTRYVVFEEDTLDGEEADKKFIEVADLFKLLLGKRLESSIFSFETTLRRIYEKEKIFYNIFKMEIKGIKDMEDLKKVIKRAVDRAKIEKELEEVKEEYNIEEENEKTWFNRVIKLISEYGEKAQEEKGYSDVDLFKLGLEVVIQNLEKDLRYMEEIFKELDKLKEKENGEIKIVGKLPTDKKDVIEPSIYLYQNDPKFETLKQIIGLPSFKSEKLKDIPSLYGKKILIFTQYKDTAYYIYHNLLNWINKETDIHRWLKDKNNRVKIGLVTGDTDINAKINYIKRFSPRANSGYEEVNKYGEIDILISTDTLSEGVNLQDADVVINYDLPWNPMVIIQRVGRVNRIGNEKEIYMINYMPSKEIEVIVGILRKLKEKIDDITLIVGKDVKILSPEEEISIETFGEKIRDISRSTITDLESYNISEDFKNFIPEGIPKEQLDEYKLLNVIQYELGYTKEDFEEVIGMDKGPYYSYIKGSDKIISVYEFYRGKYKVMKKILSIGEDGEITYETPLVFLDLIRERKRSPQKIENAIEKLKIVEKKVDKIKEELKEGYNHRQKGFLYNLYSTLIFKRREVGEREIKNIENKFKTVMIVLRTIPHYLYSKEIKPLLVSKGLIEVRRNNDIKIKDFKGTVETLFEFFKEKGLTDIESLKIKVNHVGWYYEVGYREDNKKRT